VSDERFKEYQDIIKAMSLVDVGRIYHACKAMKRKKNLQEEPKAQGLAEIVDDQLITDFVLGRFHNTLNLNVRDKYIIISDPNILYKNNSPITVVSLFSDPRMLSAASEHNRGVASEKAKRLENLIMQQKKLLDNKKSAIKRYAERTGFIRGISGQLVGKSWDEMKELALQNYLSVREKIRSYSDEAFSSLERYEQLSLRVSLDLDKPEHKKKKSANPDTYIEILKDRGIVIEGMLDIEKHGIAWLRSNVNTQLSSILPEELSDELYDARQIFKRVLTYIKLSAEMEKDKARELAGKKRKKKDPDTYPRHPMDPLIYSVRKIVEKYGSKARAEEQEIIRFESNIRAAQRDMSELSKYNDPKAFITRRSNPTDIFRHYFSNLDDAGMQYVLARSKHQDTLGPITILQFGVDNTISYHNVEDMFYDFSDAKFSSTQRKIVGFINTYNIEQYLRNAVSYDRLRLAGSKGVDDGTVVPQVLIESKAYKDFHPEPGFGLHILSLEENKGEHIYRLEGRAASNLFSDLRNPDAYASKSAEQFFKRQIKARE